jgi:diphthamide synthase (EF-2-diphthine--ammonia ligase)
MLGLFQQALQHGSRVAIREGNNTFSYAELLQASQQLAAALLDGLPSGVDPCGENGEFHSFVSSGPMLSRKIPVSVGETVEREGFAFADLLPASF